MRNRWIDVWMSMQRGQRRAVTVLLVLIVLLCCGEVCAHLYSHYRRTGGGDYTVLEQEIAQFRSLLDTIPEENRRAVYVRRTHARPDTAQSLHIDNAPRLRGVKRSDARPRPLKIKETRRVGGE